MRREVHHRKPAHAARGKGRGALVALALSCMLAVGGTIAFLVAGDEPIENVFTPSRVACAVEESFDGLTKSDVKVANTGDTDAYIRAEVLVTWQDADGNVYGAMPEAKAGDATAYDYAIAFEQGTKWVEHDGYWYYTEVVKPGDPTEDLIASCVPGTNEAPEGYSLCVEIVASAVQAEPSRAVQDAWGVTITTGAVTAVSGE